MTVLPTALLLAVAAAAPRTAVVVHATGFPDAEVQRLQDKVGAEVSGTGAELWALSKALEVRAECLENRGCAREVLRAADAGFLLWVELLRAGAQVQVSSHLLDAEGRIVAEADGGAHADVVLGPTFLVPADVLAPLKAAAAAQPATLASTTTTGTPGSTDTSGAGGTSGTGGADGTAHSSTGAGASAIEPLAQEEIDEVEPPPLSALAIGGIAALGAGTLVALGSAAVIPGQLQIIQNPASLGPEKESAATAATAAGLLAGVGALAAVGGGALLYVGLEP